MFTQGKGPRGEWKEDAGCRDTRGGQLNHCFGKECSSPKGSSDFQQTRKARKVASREEGKCGFQGRQGEVGA